ncbi:truncated glutathione S-transferase (plasmid) [Aminobacter sp. Y103A]|nr:truncated glutathione S-transferase [Aminobacter sp. SS-2016]
MRVRLALKEERYDVRIVSFKALTPRAPALRANPIYEDGDFALFESGAIVLHIAERHGGLLPDRADGGTADRLDVRGPNDLRPIVPPVFNRSSIMAPPAKLK